MDFDNYLIEEVNLLIKKKLEKITHTHKFNKTVDELYSKFKINEITILESKVKQTRKSSEIPINRCEGRIWANGKTIKENDKWIFGEQCKRKHKPDEKYCGIHLRNLGHGNFFEDVPHDHFEKYKVNNL